MNNCELCGCGTTTDQTGDAVCPECGHVEESE